MTLNTLIQEARTVLTERRKKGKKHPSTGADLEELTPKDWKFIMRTANAAAHGTVTQGKGKVYSWTDSVFVTNPTGKYDTPPHDVVTALEKYGFAADIPAIRKQRDAHKKATPGEPIPWEVSVYGRPLRPIPGEKDVDFLQRAWNYYVSSGAGEKPQKGKWGWVWEFRGGSNTYDELRELERALDSSTRFTLVITGDPDYNEFNVEIG